MSFIVLLCQGNLHNKSLTQWYGLLLKLKLYGAEGELFSLLESYLKIQEQRLVLNGQTSDWKELC